MDEDFSAKLGWGFSDFVTVLGWGYNRRRANPDDAEVREVVILDGPGKSGTTRSRTAKRWAQSRQRRAAESMFGNM